jgi:hypothetical protein
MSILEPSPLQSQRRVHVARPERDCCRFAQPCLREARWCVLRLASAGVAAAFWLGGAGSYGLKPSLKSLRVRPSPGQRPLLYQEAGENEGRSERAAVLAERPQPSVTPALSQDRTQPRKAIFAPSGLFPSCVLHCFLLLPTHASNRRDARPVPVRSLPCGNRWPGAAVTSRSWWRSPSPANSTQSIPVGLNQTCLLFA